MARPSDAELMDVVDKQKLQENLFLYCRGIDRMDTELIRSSYWPDSTDDHGAYIGPGEAWADAGVAWKDKLYSNNHHVSNVLIEIEGNRAKRESMFLCVVQLKSPSVSFFLGGRYRDLCEKRVGEWKILHRVCIWDWFEHQPTTGGWELCGTPIESTWGCFGSGDPIYGAWDQPQHSSFPRPAQQYKASHI